jgi:ABC-2 type transport system ATP-binding protein
MNCVIRTEQLTKRYRRLCALDQVNLAVQEGAVYALVGPNGAGKTTMIKVLMNLIASTSGKAEVLGIESQNIRGNAYTAIGYVSENQEMPEWMRVGALLKYLREFYPTWDKELEATLVRQLELPLRRKVRQLSRGMKMKLALASALAFRPKLIVLDEPFGGLDPLVRDQLIEGLLERATESTIFLSSHDLAEIESFASHVGYLEEGKLRFSEDMDSLAARFREVELRLARASDLPSSMPDSWLHAKASGGVVRFVESRFEEQRTGAEIQQVFGEAQDLEFRPMTLRAIFLALAKRAPSA